MKTITLLLTTILLSLNILAQVPDKISFQAVIRDTNGDLVRNQQVRMKISILLNSDTGTPVYMEIHDPVSNENGLVSLEIGNGRTTDIFTAIDWSTGIYFLKTETDPEGNSNFTISGTSQILSVPYAFHAKTVENDMVDDADANPVNELQTISLNGSDLSLSDGGGTIVIPSSADNWGTQTISSDATLLGKGTGADPLKVAHTAIQPGWANIQNMPGGFADNTDDVEDADSDPANELQTLSVSGNDLSISDGNTISLPAGITSPWESSGNDIFFNSGNVGIDTIAPSASLHVNAKEGVLFEGKFGSGTIPKEGEGFRMMWYPAKVAFRSGYAVDEWNDSIVGKFSSALGYRTTASGFSSVSMGEGAKAMGEISTAMGYLTSAKGASSTAMGSYTNASGNHSTAMGDNTVAISYNSTAMGSYNIGGGDSILWVDTDPLFEIGNGTSSLNRSNALTVLKNGNVGIGTGIVLSNNARLTVEGKENDYALVKINQKGTKEYAGLSVQRNDTEKWFIGMDRNDDKLQFRNSGSTNFMTIKEDGKVGIGVDMPTDNLHVKGTAKVELNSGSMAFTTPGGWPGIISFSSNAHRRDVVFNNLGLYLAASTSNAAPASSEGIFIEEGGNTGIGTKNPKQKLHVSNGNILLDEGHPLILSNSQYSSYVTAGGNDLILSNYATGNIRFGTSPNPGTSYDHMVINNNGKVGIGKENPEQLLHIAGENPRLLIEASSSNPEINFKHTGDSPADIWSIYKDETSGDLKYFQAGDKFTIQKNTGNVGIGTTQPTANLHVNGNDGVLFGGAFGSGTIPVEGAGVRMMWYQAKAAFRCGATNSNEWDDSMVGGYSTALGASTIASGNFSIAMGYETKATGEGSTAMGYLTDASGGYSTAIGYGTVASGQYATAMGNKTVANSRNSTAIGAFNIGGGTRNAWVDTDPLFEIGNGTQSRRNAMTVLKNGNVGIGTGIVLDNNVRLTVEGNENDYALIKINQKGTKEYTGLSVQRSDAEKWFIGMDRSTDNLQFRNSASANYMTISANGNIGIGSTNPQGKLDVNGAIYQRGGSLHADYVFEGDYQLESIEEHAEFMWQNKHLPAIPKATKDDNGEEIVEVGSHRKGIVEELEKAHIYISQLEQSIKELTLRLEKLENATTD